MRLRWVAQEVAGDPNNGESANMVGAANKQTHVCEPCLGE